MIIKNAFIPSIEENVVGVKAVMWFRNLLAPIGYPQHAPIPLYVDNMSAKHLAESPLIQRRSRHMEMFEHCDRQAVQDRVIQIIHERTADQRAVTFFRLYTRGQLY